MTLIAKLKKVKPVICDMPDGQDLLVFPPGSKGPPGPPGPKFEATAPLPPFNPFQEWLQGSTMATGILGDLPQIGLGGGAPRWGTMIPLIGGSALGCERATGVRPLFHLSYTPFAANESHLMKAWPEVPR